MPEQKNDSNKQPSYTVKNDSIGEGPKAEDSNESRRPGADLGNVPSLTAK
jgi:hypothetical protein